MSTCSTVVVSKTKPQFKILVNNVLIIPSQTTGEIEMCLRLFFGFTSLYLGCIFIGLSGIVFAVVIFSVGLFELIMGNPELLLVILAMVFGFVYAVAKLFLLFGTMWSNCTTSGSSSPLGGAVGVACTTARSCSCIQDLACNSNLLQLNVLGSLRRL
ncbi:uncharacterized protein LOC108048635 isoform X2 [Drosophila rhopaloa]|uniref:Uncharacterized protein LOC108048635 isoform X2 n=1 Tax=Drosophila rhopaloa TaxID=1041015 RepID=A0A6P4FHF1_DRORH|nr:uncharacterized protein LOC108048635 isoform X2 [Drosophila rhopaloa]